jgi:hypothetical protein
LDLGVEIEDKKLEELQIQLDATNYKVEVKMEINDNDIKKL